MTTQPTPHNPQHGAALALVALITEYPDLHRLKWELRPDGRLEAGLHRTEPGEHSDVDIRAVLADYAAVLDAEPSEPFRFQHAGQVLVYQHIQTTWRDVSVEVSTYTTPDAYPELLPAVAA